MGYQTAYELTVFEDGKARDTANHGDSYIYNPDLKNKIVKALEAKGIIDYALDDNFGCYDCVKWYEHDSDMKEISSQFPGVLFKLHGEGEDNGDLWNAYFMDGKCQVCVAQITYPPFSKEDL